jgi:predicted DNA-binding transcriptional regulator YafY
VFDIRYRDQGGVVKWRSIWPIALGYFDTTRILAAWCELRQDFRSFRADRIEKLEITERNIPRPQHVLMKEWRTHEDKSARNY